GLGASASGRFAAAAWAGASRTLHGLGEQILSSSTDAFPRTPPGGFWTGDFALAARWAVRRDFSLAVRGAYRALDPAFRPYVERLSALGEATLRRSYFKRDLDLAVTAAGHLTGRRVAPDGSVYPTVLTGSLTLTGVIRTLTLFYRLENPAD